MPKRITTVKQAEKYIDKVIEELNECEDNLKHFAELSIDRREENEYLKNSIDILKERYDKLLKEHDDLRRKAYEEFKELSTKYDALRSKHHATRAEIEKYRYQVTQGKRSKPKTPPKRLRRYI